MEYEVLGGPADFGPDSPVYGVPEYDGMNFDWEVPNEQVVASPGGVASTFHHWTKGFYGTPASSNDVFGFQPPADVYGETGNLYQTGPTAMQTAYPGPGTVYPSPPAGTSPEFLGAQPGPAAPAEPFENDDNIEYVDSETPFAAGRETYAEAGAEEGSPLDPRTVSEEFSLRTIFTLLFGWFAFSMWASAFQEVIVTKLGTGGKVPPYVTAGFATVFTLLFTLLAWK